MKKKKSITTSNKFINKKSKVKYFKRSRDDFDIEEESDVESWSPDQEMDEFECLQDIAHEPGTLHEHYEEESAEECDEEQDSSEDNKVNLQVAEDLNARGNKNKNYVNPEEFESQIKNYYKQGVLTNDLCECVFKIANRLSYRPNFVNYSFREEMVGDAIERMVFALSNKVYKYDPKKIGKNGVKGNAFLYFTKIAENAFINRIKIESRNREAITKYQDDVYHNLLQKGIDIGSASERYIE